MAYSVTARDGIAGKGRSGRKAGPQNMFGGLALACIALVCGWTVYANVFAAQPVDVIAAPTVTVLGARPVAPPVTVVAKQPAAATKPDLFKAPTFDIALLDGQPIGTPTAFGQSKPLKTALVAPPAPRVASIPLPTRRPADAPAKAAAFSLASAESKPVTTSAFDKLFGKPERGPALAYAAPDGGVFDNGQSKTPAKLPDTADGTTAVYDITASTVYMPDGTRLEAHSGLGAKMDDPRFVHVRMHGATPPHTYDLTPREALFHGVEAIRMTPVGGESAIFGRNGILAHTYMLGPNGQSNGCVSFKDYAAFLRAFKAGKVKRMVVVASGGRAIALAANN